MNVKTLVVVATAVSLGKSSLAELPSHASATVTNAAAVMEAKIFAGGAGESLNYRFCAPEKGVVDPDVVKCRQWLAERWHENDANGDPVGERGEPFPIDMPLPWLERDNYDWFERHNSCVELARTTNPQVVFIGDSITHGWEMNDQRGDAKGVFDRWFGKYSTLNLGFGWDRIQNVLWRLEHGEMDGTNPKVVVIHIGTNNTAPGYKYNAAPNPPGEIADGILVVCKKVRELAPKARIVLMKVFPRGKTPADPYRGKVAAVNAELDRRLASFHDDRLTVIDMHDKFVDAEGNISLDLTIDYLHPTAKGYDLWAAALAPIIERGCKITPTTSCDNAEE